MPILENLATRVEAVELLAPTNSLATRKIIKLATATMLMTAPKSMATTFVVITVVITAPPPVNY